MLGDVPNPFINKDPRLWIIIQCFIFCWIWKYKLVVEEVTAEDMGPGM
jgi:hypothetical protein